MSQAMRRSEAQSSAGRYAVVFCMPSTLCQGSQPTPTVQVRTGGPAGACGGAEGVDPMDRSHQLVAGAANKNFDVQVAERGNLGA